MASPRLGFALALLAACSSGPGAPSPPSPSSSPKVSATRSGPTAVPPTAIVERDRALYVLSVGVSRRITPAGFYPAGRRAIDPPVTVSADRAWALAYTPARPGWYVLRTAGGAPLPLLGSAQIPVWSTRGDLAYVADGDLYVGRPGARAVAILRQQPAGCCFALAWSPDGGTLGMETFDRSVDREQIWVVNRNGKGLRRVFAGAKADRNPVAWALGFSPDGSRLLTTNTPRPTVVTLRGGARTLAGDPVLHDGSPPGFTWWGMRVLVNTRARSPRLAWEDASSGVIEEFADPVAAATDSYLAPDASLLAITLARVADGKVSVWVVGPDGSGLRRLSEWGPDARIAGWSEGSIIYTFSATRAIHATPPSGASFGLGTGRIRAAA